MGRRTAQTLPPRLEAGRDRFEQWRSERGPRRRIPEALWRVASELGVEFGVHRTAKALRLNYDALKARVLVVGPIVMLFRVIARESTMSLTRIPSWKSSG